MKTEAILFLLSIHEGNELRDQLPSSAYDELAAAGLLDGTDITEKGYAYVRLLCDVPEPVQMWADPRNLAGNPGTHDDQMVRYLKSFDPDLVEKQIEARRRRQQLPKDAGVKVDIVLQGPEEAKQSARATPTSEEREALVNMVAKLSQKAVAPPIIDIVPAGYQPNPGQIPGGVDRAADIQIVRANGKRKTLPAQSVNWADAKTPDRVIGWRYAAAPGEARIHTPGETMPAPDA